MPTWGATGGSDGFRELPVSLGLHVTIWPPVEEIGRLAAGVTGGGHLGG